MKKSTAQIIVVSVVILIMLNITLIVLQWTGRKNGNSSQQRPIEEVNAFIIKEIGFDQKQAESFIALAEKHYETQRRNQNEFIGVKDQMNLLMLEDDDNKMDSLISTYGEICITREAELYSFFKEILLICNEDQKKRLQRVFFEATGPPQYGKVPFGHDARNQHRPK